MTIATYKLGPPTRPNIHHDNGFLDQFKMRAPTADDRIKFSKWAGRLELRESAQHLPFVNDLSDALAAYRHFLYGNGKDRMFSYERYVNSDAGGRVTLTNVIADAREGAEQLYAANFASKSPVQFQMTSSAIAAGGPNVSLPYPRTENWQKAIGAHNLWISADVQATLSLPGNLPRFTMQMTLHVEDRYNFNPGAHDIATGIPDSENGIFEITGLARQYMNYSTLTRKVEWTGGAGAHAGVRINPADVGRQRQPSDNLRLRNRI